MPKIDTLLSRPGTSIFLQIRYTSFLEMLKRNTAKEIEAVLENNAVIGPFDNINRNWGDKIAV